MMAVIITSWVGLNHAGQSTFPPILFGDTGSFQLYIMNPGCPSLWESCQHKEQFLLDGLYSLPVAEWSPNGRSIAVHLNDGWMIYPADCLLARKTCEAVPVKPAGQAERVAWGPDGTTLASYDTSLKVSTIQSSGCWQGDRKCLEISITLSDNYSLTEMAWSADGNLMAFSDYARRVLVWLDTACFDKPEGCVGDSHLISVGANPISWPSFSADGRSVLLMTDTSINGTSQQLFIVDLESGAQQQITFRAGIAEYPDWSVDGRYVLFSGFATPHSGDLELYLLDLQRQITVPIMQQEGRDLAFASWGYRPQ